MSDTETPPKGSSQVHPVVAIVLIVIVLGLIALVYNYLTNPNVKYGTERPPFEATGKKMGIPPPPPLFSKETPLTKESPEPAGKAPTARLPQKSGR